ncbi:MAG: tRNA pseudouridine(54/55) synthase Pus10 [Candidatus Heimdallarchaeaceae archaeon]
MDLQKVAKKILEEYALCNHCLGRQFSNLATGTTNEKRGQIIKSFLAMAYSRDDAEQEFIKILAENKCQLAENWMQKKGISHSPYKKCQICKNKIKEVDNLIPLIHEKIKDIEFSTFLVGTIIPGEWYERERILKEKYQLLDSEFLKQEFNRLIGKRLTQIADIKTDFDHPEIIIEVNPLTYEIKTKIHSVYIYGRYRKLVRTIPQTHWPCKKCKGKGCDLCNYTGKRYNESVEELIAFEAVKMFKAEKGILHGSGREDIDARMLGRGRPFVLELVEPKRRTVDLNKLMKRTNKYAKKKVEVLDYRYSTKKELIHLKTRAQLSVKKYRALIEFKHPISKKDIEAIEKTFKELTINQRTPKRVAHRRADKIRKKTVYSISCKQISDTLVKTTITCSGGCYVKELISGDEGRTKPSISEITKNEAICKELDVLEVCNCTEKYS